MLVAFSFYYLYTERATAQPGSGAFDPRLWWEEYYAGQRRPQREPEPAPVEAFVELTGVQAITAVGSLQVLSAVAVEGVRSRARTGWLETRPDPYAEIRQRDEEILLAEP